jgi:hypothetical protein
MNSAHSFSQDLSSHLWKNRLLLVITDSIKNNTYDDQLKMLREFEEGVSERKLIVYKVIPEKYSVGLLENAWIASPKLYNDFKKNNDSEFEIILIGLDGGVKLRTNELLIAEELFGRIDSMPMRIREMQRKNID